jgi:hypothetical protein
MLYRQRGALCGRRNSQGREKLIRLLKIAAMLKPNSDDLLERVIEAGAQRRLKVRWRVAGRKSSREAEPAY